LRLSQRNERDLGGNKDARQNDKKKDQEQVKEEFSGASYRRIGFIGSGHEGKDIVASKGLVLWRSVVNLYPPSGFRRRCFTFIQRIVGHVPARRRSENSWRLSYLKMLRVFTPAQLSRL
jgi:hypothetical protein